MPDINTENRSVNSPDLNTERNSPEFFRDMFLAKTSAEDGSAPDDSASGVSLAQTLARTSAAKPAEAQDPERCSPILPSAKTAVEDKPAENDSARYATPGKDILPPDFPYADIINLPRPEPKKHKRMTRQDRAAQFAPFAALTGLDEIMEEKEQEALDFSE